MEITKSKIHLQRLFKFAIRTKRMAIISLSHTIFFYVLFFFENMKMYKSLWEIHFWNNVWSLCVEA